MNLDDEEGLGAMNFEISNSVVQASSGRGLGSRANPDETLNAAPSSQTTQIAKGVLSGLLGPSSSIVSSHVSSSSKISASNFKKAE